MVIKVQEANDRLMRNVFVCRNCKKKYRVDPLKIIRKEFVCKNCSSKNFRPLRKKK